MDELYMLLSRLTDDDGYIIRQIYAILYRYLERRNRLESNHTPTNYKGLVVRLLSKATEKQAKVCYYFLKGTME